MTQVVVVGGGIAGLTAALRLLERGARVRVLEADEHVGGKLRTGTVAGIGVDVGAEAMLQRRPEGVDLARRLGLEIVHPALASSRIWTGGALRPLPRSLLGVPMDLGELASSGILDEASLERVRAEPTLGPEAVETGEDITVGDLIDRRLGTAVTDRLVEPLLGGVYAGHARRISARAAAPQLLAYAARGSLLEQAAALGAGEATYRAPVFAGIPGGMGRLPAALAEAIVERGGEVRTHTPALALRHDGAAWSVRSAADDLSADAVVVALPAPGAADLLRATVPTAAAELAAVDVADVVVVTFAFAAAQVGRARLEGSGFLVPPTEGRRIKAATFSFAKWDWVREAGRGSRLGDVCLLRTSLGRAGDGSLGVDDDEIVAASLHDLAAATGLRASPVDVHVQRWTAGLPQYALGHLDRVVRIRAALARHPGLAVAGATYDGVGIPAVIASAEAAVASLERTVRMGP